MLSFKDIKPTFRDFPFPAVVVSVKDGYKIEEVTSAFARITNKSIDQLKDRSLFEAFPDYDYYKEDSGVKQVRRALEKAAQSHQPLTTGIFRYDLFPQNCLEREKRYWRAEVTPLVEDEQEVNYVIQSLREVTECVEDSKESGFFADSMGPILENSPNAIFISKPESGEILFANAKAEELFGYKPDEFLKIARQTIIAHDDKNFIKLLEERDERGKAKGEAIGIRRDGQRFSCQYSSVIFYSENERKALTMIEDLSELKEAVQRAERNERRFRALIEHSEDIIIVSGRDLIVTYVSPAFTKVTGYTVEEIKEKGIWEIFHQENLMESLKMVPLLEQNPGVAYPRINRLRTKEGRYVWVEGTLVNLSEDDGFEAYVANYRDITARREAEERILESERNLRTIFDNSIEGFVLTDTELRIKASNKKAAEFFELNEKPTTLEPGSMLLDFFESDKKEIFQAAVEQVLKGETVSYKSTYARDGGQETWYNFRVAPVFAEGTVIGICITGRDITMYKVAEQKLEAREKRYRALVENSDDAFAILSGEGKVTYVSSSVKKVLGYTEEEALEMDFSLITFQEDLVHLKAVMEKLLQNPGVPINGFTGRMRHKDGSWRWIEATATNMLHVPEIGGIIDTFRDVTEKVNYLKAIEEQNKRFREIAWTQSHLVRAPLSRVLGLVNLIENDPSTVMELLPLLKISADELDDIIRQIVKKTEQVDM